MIDAKTAVAETMKEMNVTPKDFGATEPDPAVEVAALADEPAPADEWITTRAQRRAIMDRDGWEYRQKRLDLIPGRKVHFDMGRR